MAPVPQPPKRVCVCWGGKYPPASFAYGIEFMILAHILHYWVSEASPTLGCSIEISRDICMLVCLKETHTKNTYVKNAWAELRGPKMRMLKVSLGGGGKQACDTRSIHFYYMLEQL